MGKSSSRLDPVKDVPPPLPESQFPSFFKRLGIYLFSQLPRQLHCGVFGHSWPIVYGEPFEVMVRRGGELATLELERRDCSRCDRVEEREIFERTAESFRFSLWRPIQ